MLIDCYFYLFNIECETDGEYSKYYDELIILSQIHKSSPIKVTTLLNTMKNKINNKNITYTDNDNNIPVICKKNQI